MEEDAEEPELLQVTRWASQLGPQPHGHVKRLIPANSVILLAGKPKTGKTFLALEIAEAVATGDHCLGLETIQGPVAYFSMEDSPWQFKERLTMRGTLERSPEFYIYKGRRDVSTLDGATWLERKVADVGPSLIVLDTARQAFGMTNWNDAAEVTQRLRPLMDLAARLPNGGSILLVAHSNKNPFAEGGDRISGSNALQSAVDCYMIIDKVQRNSDNDLTGEADCQGRIEMPPKFGWVMNHQTLRFTVMSEEERERKARSRDAKNAGDRVVDAINKLGGEATTVEIAKELNMSVPHVTSMVREAAKSKRIETVRKVQTDVHHKASVWGVRMSHDLFAAGDDYSPHTPLIKSSPSSPSEDDGETMEIDV